MIDDDNFLDESQHISHGRHLTTVQSSALQYFSSVGQIDKLTKVLKDPSSEAVMKVSLVCWYICFALKQSINAFIKLF